MSKFILETTNFTQIGGKKRFKILDLVPPLKKIHILPPPPLEKLAMALKCDYIQFSNSST